MYTAADMYSLYHKLPITLKRLCGEISLPTDGGNALLKHLHSNNLPLMGMSDASLKEGQCGHSWILSTGDPDHIDDQNMSMRGAGAIDGAPHHMSFSRGELHGQTAMAIMSKLFLDSHHDSTRLENRVSAG